MRRNKARLFVAEVIASAFAFNRGLLFKSQLLSRPLRNANQQLRGEAWLGNRNGSGWNCASVPRMNKTRQS